MSEENKEKEPEVKTGYEWNGEKIRRKVDVPDKNIDPKDLLQQLDQQRNQTDQMKDNLIKIENAFKKQKESITSAEEMQKEMEEFEEGSIKIQTDKLNLFVKQIEAEGNIQKEAIEEAEKILEKDPNAYSEEHARNQKYVIYQQKIATSEKIATRIAPRIIKEFLYEKPVFKNPFAPVEEAGSAADATPEEK